MVLWVKRLVHRYGPEFQSPGGKHGHCRASLHTSAVNGDGAETGWSWELSGQPDSLKVEGSSSLRDLVSKIK